MGGTPGFRGTRSRRRQRLLEQGPGPAPLVHGQPSRLKHLGQRCFCLVLFFKIMYLLQSIVLVSMGMV